MPNSDTKLLNAELSLARQAQIADDEQELKEAVCDAVLERMRRVVTGDGEFGMLLFGQEPSRMLTSGFLLPRLSADADDESSDISIPVHGLDLRLKSDAPDAVIRIQPHLNVYIRVLPTSQELFSASLNLRPKARFNTDADTFINQRLRALREDADFKRQSTKERLISRRNELLKAWNDLGVVGSDDHISEETSDIDVETEVTPGINGTVGEIRIPDPHSAAHEIPKKFLRLRVQTPALLLPIPYKEEQWAALVAAYEVELQNAVTQAYKDWLSSNDGALHAWRNVMVPSSSFWSQEAWDARLIIIRAQPINLKNVVPGMLIKFIANAIPDPLSKNILTARFALENFQNGKGEGEQGLFQVFLQAEVPTPCLHWINMERVKRSYHFSGFMRVAAIGVNGGVEHQRIGNSDLLTTTWMPRFVLPRMKATELAGVPVSYKKLMSQSLPVDTLSALPDIMESWVNDVKAKTILFEPGEQGTIE